MGVMIEEPDVFQGDVPSLRSFRGMVDNIPVQRDRVMVELLYLTASRVNEFCTHGSPSDKTTRPLGNYVNYDFANYKKEKDTFLIASAILKRKEKKKEGEQEIQGLKFKVTGLPTNPEFEPWVTNDILPWIVKKKDHKISIDLNRMTVNRIIKEEFRKFNLKVHAHSLRHFRLSHLSMNYGFEPAQLIQYAGWTFKSGLASMGQSSGQLDIYVHSNWRSYAEKLHVPLEDVL